MNRPSWNQVSKSGGLWAANLRATGHTCDRVPLAISPKRCVNVKWCHTGCVFGAKNSLYTNYLPSAERLGVKIRPHAQVESVRQVQNRPYRYSVTVSNIDPASRAAGAAATRSSARCWCSSTGAMGNVADPDALPQRPAVAVRAGGPAPRRQRRPHRRDRVRPQARARGARACPRYADFHKGKPITTMTYDFWVGRRVERVRRHALHAPGDLPVSSLTNFLYDDGREPGGDPSWWGLQKKEAIANWANRIELLAMVEDTNDGDFFAVPPTGGGAMRPERRPGGGRARSTTSSREQSLRVREAADAAMKRIGEHRGLGRFMKLTETEGSYASHPLGGCRMAESTDLGVTDHTRRRVRLRGPLLHRLLDHPDLARASTRR